MIDNTINDDKTIVTSGEGAILVRSLRCQCSLNLIFPIRDALRHELSWAQCRGRNP